MLTFALCAPLPRRRAAWRLHPFRPFCGRQTTTHASLSEGIRINKCFKSFASRRESDAFIAAGRVLINSAAATAGSRVFPGDTVSLDGRAVEWERLTVAATRDAFVYLKHWKELGVTCTTDERIAGNVISAVRARVPARDRVFPVGRLDAQTSGLLLLTSDGRVPGAVLGAARACDKEYVVTADRRVADAHVVALRAGVRITTEAQRDGARRRCTARTLACDVRRGRGRRLVVRLREGRNRQIRKMLGALGYTAVAIHRTRFLGIGLDGLEEGGVRALDEAEMEVLQDKLDAWEAGA